MHTLTQFMMNGNGEPRGVCDLVVGLDFGTSCTKVVVQSPYHHNERAYAIPFEGAAHPSSPFLLPSELHLDSGGRASLVSIPGGIHLRDIKFHLMQSATVTPTNATSGGPAFDATTLSTVFLALAMRQARRWFLDTQQAMYGDYRLRWHVNLGLPSEDYADEVLCERYRRLAAAAWLLSLSENPFTVAAAEMVLASVSSETRTVEGTSIEIIPEVAAEVVGYARSHQRDEGLHILIDIGASTLDICAFILHEKEEGDDGYELLTADVEELGAMVLFRNRLQGICRAVTTHTSQLLRACDPVNPIPARLKNYLPKQTALTRALGDHDDAYRNRCRQAIWKTLVDLRTRRDPKSPRWKDAIPVFIAGGAAGMPFYEELINAVSAQVQQMYAGCGGFRTLPLTTPEKLRVNVDEAMYHRLAVAWGLSYPETDIGEITRPSDIVDIMPRIMINRDHLLVTNSDV